MKLLSAVVAGHICLDIIPQFDSGRSFDFKAQFQPGSLTRVGPAIFSTGGAVSNTGLALHKLGTPTRLVALTGDDPFGQAVRRIVTSFDDGTTNLADGLSILPQVATSYTIIISPPGVDRLFIHCPGANDEFGPQDVPVEALAQAGLFHFGYPPVMRRMYQDGGAELALMYLRAKGEGATTSLDLCMPDPTTAAGQVDWGVLLARVLPQVDIFTPSLDELLFMLDRPAYQDLQALGMRRFLQARPGLPAAMGRRLLHLGSRIVLIKLSDCGAYLCTAQAGALANIGRAAPTDPAAWANQSLWAPCFAVALVGATGAGDAAIAGFLNALLRGLSPGAALTAAVGVGACNVEAADALSGVPDWETVQRRIAAGWPRRKQFEALEGWQWGEAEQAWVQAPAV